jgi:hypothetical protein
MGTEDKKTSLAFKDILSIILSLAAFALSITSFYFVNYKVEDNLQARVTNTDFIRSPTKSNGCDTAIVQVAFVNGGNRQAIVLAPWFQLADTTNSYNGAWGGDFDNRSSFPIILQPHEMKLVDLKLSARLLTLNPSRISKENPSMYEYYLAVEYFSLDSKAKKHDVWGEFNVHIFAKGDTINFVNETDNLNKYNSTSLFSDQNKSNTLVVSKSRERNKKIMLF